jgi:stage III sporulation protein AB
MLKLLGACLVLIATTWSGFYIASRYSQRPLQIRQLRSALSLLETEIGYGARPLKEASYSISNRIKGPVGGIFARFASNLEKLDGASTYECFAEAIQEEWENSLLGQAEKQILLDFAHTLGGSDREDQLQHLMRARMNLEVEEEKAREEQQQYEKMIKTLGVLSGALLIILMI